ncbi:MAG: hypothetical protein VX096_01905 [Pseudomonadota bacterium]|nr:hypothetical protein [Pseudomonadota bacterium]
MIDSSDTLIHEIIDDYQCPFTASEVHGFFTGLVLSNISNIDLDKKILTFMDIDDGSLSKSRKLIECIQNELKSSNLDIQAGEDSDYKMIASSLAEWTYYFLISYKESGSSKNIDNRIIEILDIFDEISQLNQKYKVDCDNNVNKESLNDIHDFIEKSIQYIFNKKDDK